MNRNQRVSLTFGSLVFKLPQIHLKRRGCGWKSVGGVLDVPRDSSFVRKIKAAQKIDARGVCMLCVVSVISSG